MIPTTDPVLYVLTAIFNPFNFASRYRLYNRFVKEMQGTPGVKLFTVEAAFGNAPFRVTDADNPMNLQLRTNQVFWHKERMLNLALEKLTHVIPSAYFIATLDADITFTNPGWVAQTTHALSHLAVVQPFAQAANLDAREEVMWTCPGSINSFINGRGYHQYPPLPVSYTYKGHPGLAWAYTRDTLEQLGGLFDVCVAGSADTVMSNAFKGDYSVYLPGAPSKGMVAAMEAWALRAVRVVRGRLGYVSGTVMHHWHGASERRGYEKRWDIMSFHGFDPNEDILVEENGLYRWAGNKPALEDDIRLSLGARNEDAV